MTRVVVVTGAAGGIGAATCDRLVSRGWDVVPVDRVPVGRPNAMEIDLADVDAITSALKGLPRVDALVNNAALQHFASIPETSFEQWDAVQAVNVRAAFACIKTLYPQLVNAQGSVVNVSSVHSRATSRSIAAYAASKGALSALTRAAALELADVGVRVNAVVPGAVDTSALREGFARKADAEEELVARTPLGRIGTPAEIARVIEMLLDPELAGFITGQEIVADGGALARLSTE